LRKKCFRQSLRVPEKKINGSESLVSTSPSEAVDEEADGEGAEDAPDREDGDGDGPDGGEGALADGLLVSLEPRLIDVLLNHLWRGERRQMEIFLKRKKRKDNI